MSEDLTQKTDLPRQIEKPESQGAPSLPQKGAPSLPQKKEGKEKKRLKLVSPEASAAVAEERDKVVHIVRRLEEEHTQWRVGRKKAPWFLLSLLLCVALPTLVASGYYFLIAADRYVADARFAVRSNEQPAFDALGMLTGMPSSQTVSDSYMVADYITSREMARLLDQQVSLRGIYSDARADFLTRLDPDVSLESLVSYWNKRVDVLYDSAKTTIAVEVQAFSPDDAARVATAILENVRDLVNSISANARRDAVEFASRELARAELRVRSARKEVLDFRMAHNDLDPMLSAEATLQIAAGLEAERTQLNTQLATLSGYLSDDAPSLQMLKSRMAALEREIGRIQGQVSQGSTRGAVSGTATGEAPSGAMAETIAEYQELQMTQQFAEQGYTSALTALERARSEAERTQSYLAIYLPPKPTDAATYPKRGTSVLVVLILSAIFWAIGLLGFLTVRDHMA
jgi:capsular polysaccharide transport system permease protein